MCPTKLGVLQNKGSTNYQGDCVEKIKAPVKVFSSNKVELFQKYFSFAFSKNVVPVLCRKPASCYFYNVKR